MNNNIILNNCQIEVDESFLPRKLKSLTLAEVYDALGESSRSRRVENCGSFLEFHINDTEQKLHSANFCKDRLCPMCNWRRSKKIFAQVSSVMDSLEKKDYRFLFLTMTVRNCKFSDLETAVSLLLDGWRNLYRSKEFKKSISGAFRTMEITINKEEGTFHPHLHCILVVEPSYFHKGYISQRKWCELWQKACNLDYIPVCDIRTVKSGNLDSVEGIDSAMPKVITYKSATKEVSKYIAKGSDYLEGSFEEICLRVSYLLEAIISRRLCSMIGVFKTEARLLKLDDIENGDLVHVDDDEVRPDVSYVVVRYHWRIGFYESEVIDGV